ncbi:unnamed protein product [Mytilus coruscus]|uniref:HECT domain-containing protein n=1 Tax=Mytilus coruscus TaxID=42192 RepID=A0A6J7ZXZ0_MYTCO|nr:unnamed protein product [Mytilus coruscus]
MLNKEGHMLQKNPRMMISLEVISTIKNTYQEIPEKELKIRRNNIIKDVLQYYEDPTILNFKIKVIFEGEIGEDLGGLTRDMFSSFWKKACQEFFRGEDSVVPSLPIHRRREAADIFAAIGRVLCHMIGVFDEPGCNTTFTDHAVLIGWLKIVGVKAGE